MRQKRQRAAVGLAAFAAAPPRESASRPTIELPMSITLMISAALVSSLRVLRIRDCSTSLRRLALALDERHDGHAGLEAGQAQRELGKQHDAP